MSAGHGGEQRLAGARLPLSQGSWASGLVIVSADEVAILVEGVVEGGVDGAELLQCLHLPEPQHRSLSSSEVQM